MSERFSALMRQDFIISLLLAPGHVNRRDVAEAFGVSEAQAAVDFKNLLRAHPQAMLYDPRAKAYLPTSELGRLSAPDLKAARRMVEFRDFIFDRYGRKAEQQPPDNRPSPGSRNITQGRRKILL